MTFEQLQKYAKRRNCAVRWIETRNGNTAMQGRIALHVVCYRNGRSTNFYGVSKAQPRKAAEWIKHNS